MMKASVKVSVTRSHDGKVQLPFTYNVRSGETRIADIPHTTSTDIRTVEVVAKDGDVTERIVEIYHNCEPRLPEKHHIVFNFDIEARLDGIVNALCFNLIEE